MGKNKIRNDVEKYLVSSEDLRSLEAVDCPVAMVPRTGLAIIAPWRVMTSKEDLALGRTRFSHSRAFV